MLLTEHWISVLEYDGIMDALIALVLILDTPNT